MPLAVITGASAGVGRAAARLFAERGFDLVLIARGEKGLIEARKEVRKLGRNAAYFTIDVANSDSVFQAVEDIENNIGNIDVWVNNAMVSVFGPISSLEPYEVKRVTEVNYLGYVYCTMACLKFMKKRNSGHIVQVCSALSFRGIPLQAPYCATKHAIEGYTESLRCELIHDKSSVVVNMVHMPALNTPQFSWSKVKLKKKPQPVPPIYQPEIAAEAILYAATRKVRQVKLGWNTKVIVAGNKLFPSIGDWYLARNGYKGQKTDEDVKPDREDNLLSPVDHDKDFGAHGRFDQKAKKKSYNWEMTKFFRGFR